MAGKSSQSSPAWSDTTKLIVNILFLITAIGLLVKFSSLITPIVIALLLTLIIHPVAEILSARVRISWSLAVNLIFLILVILLIALLAMGGLALVQQVQDLILFIQEKLPNLPQFLTDITSQSMKIGPFVINLSQINWREIGNQLIQYVQPMLAEMGGFIGSLATGAAQVVGTIFLAFILSYLLTGETGGKKEKIFLLNIPDYQYDLDKMWNEIKIIWNAFLKGQAIVIVIRTILYSILLGALGVRFYVGLAIGAGIANLIPYIGVAVAWVTYFFVALFQGTTLFGLDSFSYALIVTISAWILDNVYDNTVTPRIMGGALKLHPAAIMLAALVGLNLFGLMGMFLAAPVLASLKLIFQYTQRKMQDKDPWENIPRNPEKEEDIPLLGRMYQKSKKIINDRTNEKKKKISKEKK